MLADNDSVSVYLDSVSGLWSYKTTLDGNTILGQGYDTRAKAMEKAYSMIEFLKSRFPVETSIRGKNLNIRLTHEELVSLRQNAKSENKTLTAFVVAKCCQEVKE